MHLFYQQKQTDFRLWIKHSPSTFGDELGQKSLFSFLRYLGKQGCFPKEDLKESLAQVDEHLRKRYKI